MHISRKWHFWKKNVSLGGTLSLHLTCTGFWEGGALHTGYLPVTLGKMMNLLVPNGRIPFLDHSWKLEVMSSLGPVPEHGCLAAVLSCGLGHRESPVWPGWAMAGWASGCCGLLKARFLGWSLRLLFLQRTSWGAPPLLRRCGPDGSLDLVI